MGKQGEAGAWPSAAALPACSAPRAPLDLELLELVVDLAAWALLAGSCSPV